MKTTKKRNTKKSKLSRTASTSDITITKVSYDKFSGLESSQLTLLFKNGNNKLVNTLRRVCFELIPTYSFCSKTIDIQTNTSIFDNDYMRMRISQIAIPKIVVPVTYLPEEFYKDINYGDKSRPKHPEDNLIIEMNINVTNDTNDNLNVTTNHAEFFVDGITKQSFSEKYPSLLIQLRPNDKFVMHGIAALGIGKNNDIWSAIRNCYYHVKEDNNIEFTIESTGQQSEFEILNKACDIIVKKYNDLKDLLWKNNEESKKENYLKLVLENENHTVGELLNYYLQENKHVIFSGMAKPDLLLQQITIKIKTDGENISIVINQTIDIIIEIIKNIQQKIAKLA